MNNDGTVGRIQMLQSDERKLYQIQYIDEKDPADADTLEYLIPPVEQRELEDIQYKLNQMLPRLIPAMNNIEDTMVDAEITESTIGQKVPDIPTIIIDEEKEETINKLLNEEKSDKDVHQNQTLNPGYYDPDTIEDYEESETLTVDCHQMNNISNNSGIQSLSDDSYVDIDKSYNVNLEKSYMMDWTVLEPEAEEYEIVNSTQSEAVVPELEHNSRPIRRRNKPDYYQAS